MGAASYGAYPIPHIPTWDGHVRVCTGVHVRVLVGEPPLAESRGGPAVCVCVWSRAWMPAHAGRRGCMCDGMDMRRAPRSLSIVRRGAAHGEMVCVREGSREAPRFTSKTLESGKTSPGRN